MTAPAPVRGRAMEVVSEDRIHAIVEELLSAYENHLGGVSSLVVLPAAHYPYHPTTGQVTNPVVTEAVARTLVDVADPDRLVVCIAGSALSDGETVAKYLGYVERFRGTGIEVVPLAGNGGLDRAHTGRRSVPSILRESVVVNVPTLRCSSQLRMVGGLANLAWAVTTEPDSDFVTTVTESVSPSLSVLDGTYVFDGVPSKSKFLLESADLVALDQVCASILGLDSEEVPYLPPPTEPAPSLLHGVRIESLRADINSRPMATGGTSGDLMATGYRLYSRLSGDVLPPQFVGDADG